MKAKNLVPSAQMTNTFRQYTKNTDVHRSCCSHQDTNTACLFLFFRKNNRYESVKFFENIIDGENVKIELKFSKSIQFHFDRMETRGHFDQFFLFFFLFLVLHITIWIQNELTNHADNISHALSHAPNSLNLSDSKKKSPYTCIAK